MSQSRVFFEDDFRVNAKEFQGIYINHQYLVYSEKKYCMTIYNTKNTLKTIQDKKAKYNIKGILNFHDYETALKYFKKSGDYVYALLNVYLLSLYNNSDENYEYLEKALTLYPNNELICEYYAYHLFNTKKYDEFKNFVSLKKLNTNMINVFTAKIYNENNNNEMTETFFKLALDKDKIHYKCACYEYAMYLKDKDETLYIDYLTISANLGFLPSILELANFIILRKLKNSYLNILQILLNVVSSSNNNIYVNYYCAIIFYKTYNYEEALKFFNKAKILGSDYYIGNIYAIYAKNFSKDYIKLAKKHYKLLISNKDSLSTELFKAKRTLPKSYYMLGLYYYNKNNTIKYLSMFNKAYNLGYFKAGYKIAKYYYKNNKIFKAIKYLKKYKNLKNCKLLMLCFVNNEVYFTKCVNLFLNLNYKIKDILKLVREFLHDKLFFQLNIFINKLDIKFVYEILDFIRNVISDFNDDLKNYLLNNNNKNNNNNKILEIFFTKKEIHDEMVNYCIKNYFNNDISLYQKYQKILNHENAKTFNKYLAIYLIMDEANIKKPKKKLCLICFDEFYNITMKCEHKICALCMLKVDKCPYCRM
ncbi:RING domain protein [Hokovirus HKV1]|uniref:RING domain protein n=1 Tax=Hokovirus HKV1 TaxID=1977638 RepID=A0A1V0SG46_9VIRU|nr:RING domain protein [Hokovirus HKV1]